MCYVKVILYSWWSYLNVVINILLFMFKLLYKNYIKGMFVLIRFLHNIFWKSILHACLDDHIGPANKNYILWSSPSLSSYHLPSPSSFHPPPTLNTSSPCTRNGILMKKHALKEMYTHTFYLSGFYLTIEQYNCKDTSDTVEPRLLRVNLHFTRQLRCFTRIF